MNIDPELSAYIRAHRDDDVRHLALSDQKRLGDSLNYALNQISGWQKAKEKIPSWSEIDDLVYPPHLSMEQCSSEQTAAYKATLVRGESFTDLTGGFGVDFAFIARNFKQATMVERNAELCEIAVHNLPLLGLPDAKVVNGDGMDHLRQMEPVDVIFIDPARRDQQGRKTVSIADCEPNLLEVLETLRARAKKILIKYSPMLDITLAIKELEGVESVHVVSVENECKELLFLLSEKTAGSPLFHCVNLSKRGETRYTFTMEEERNATIRQAGSIGKYLYEPYSSLLKAGAYKSLCTHFPVEKLAVSSHLYTSDEPINDFPGRAFRVVDTFTLNKKEVKEHLGNVKKANIAVRNFPLSANELRNRLKIKEGGDIYIFATTHMEKRLVIMCEKA
ncbi:MAG: RsmD family RNA methyltransferase [Paludibacteraceae bacterium]|nr:RsmD family RNA methyltransferase [Paludibacteraceae bacterium]